MGFYMNTNVNNLHSKFHPYLLGHASCPANFKKDIDKVFKQPLKVLKNNIFDAGDWVLKLPRTVGATTHDANLYRVRKAEKIRSYICKYGLKDELIVPQKYLYWHQNTRQL